MDASLYIHIPFCLRKCIYCDFVSVPYEKDLAVRYVEAVGREISRFSGGSGQSLKSLYIGGGTPTILPETAFEGIFGPVREKFALCRDAEITVEANPGTLDASKVKTLKRLGTNRLSIGVQSMSERELAVLGRAHTPEDAVFAFRAAKEGGIENVSVDLIYGIPGQDAESWLCTLHKALSLKPAHISAYELAPEEGTPLRRLIAEGRLSLPDEDTVIGMLEKASSLFRASGYVRYEISNYALPGFECRHNLNYWLRGRYFGAGASASSFTEGVRRKNTKDVESYIRLILEGSSPVCEKTPLGKEDCVKETVFLGLRTKTGLSPKAFNDAFGLDIKGASEGLVADGLMELDGEALRLTEKGILFSNRVFIRIFENLGLPV